MDAMFSTENYEKDLALVFLEMLFKADKCSPRRYKAVRKTILRGDDSTDDGTNNRPTECSRNSLVTK